MAIKVAFMQLSSCWGCHQSLLNLHLGLLPVLPQLDIVYWPAVVDFKLSSLEARAPGSVDVGFLEGMLRTEHDVHNAKTMRDKCKVLIAYGTCATYGSVKGLANQWTKEELLKRKFMDCESVGEPNDFTKNIDPELTPICDHVVNLDKVVKIDAYLPGCPPKKENILGAVAFLISNPAQNAKKDTNVCAPCKASPCLLEVGKLCFGPVTAGGCTLACPNNNIDACVGCFGATAKLDDEKAAKLKSMLSGLQAGHDDANLISRFLILFNGLPSQGSLYLPADPMRKLALGEVKEFTDDVQGAALKALAHSKAYQFANGNVCSTCDRNGNMNKSMDAIKRYYEAPTTGPDPEACFINQGMICMGPVTQAGCGAICTNNGNSVCNGCYGPVFGVTEQGARGISTMASLADVDIKEISEKILDPVGLFYRYTLACSEINKKVDDNKA